MEVRFTPLLLWAITLSVAHADESPVSTHGVLHSSNHPQSPDYANVYPGAPAPIDNKISWTKRFKGDARFNTPQRVESEQKSADRLPQKPASAGGFDATGVVKKVDPLSQKVKLAHGPIDRLGMPAMTMVFRTTDPDVLAAAKVGDEVSFNVSETEAGFELTALAPLNASPVQAGGDGQGVVKSIRNGKVKLKHGPIEKFGMPGMTMMFRTADPKILDGLAPGAEVEFDVESTDSGFTITRIKALKGAQ